MTLWKCYYAEKPDQPIWLLADDRESAESLAADFYNTGNVCVKYIITLSSAGYAEGIIRIGPEKWQRVAELFDYWQTAPNFLRGRSLERERERLIKSAEAR